MANSSGRKTVTQTLRVEFDPIKISELTGHVNPEWISITAIIMAYLKNSKGCQKKKIGWLQQFHNYQH